MAYTAHILTDDARDFLLSLFPPENQKVIAHHITVEFGVSNDTPPPVWQQISVIGRVSVDGLEALVCAVDGETKRSDGSTYHITWSLDPDRFKPVDSNRIIAESGLILFPGCILVEAFPAILQ